MELVEKLRACFFGSCFKGDTRNRLGGAKIFCVNRLSLTLNRAFSLTWPVARQIYYNKRKRKQEWRGLVWDANMAAVLLLWDWPILQTWLKVLKGPEGCIGSQKPIDERNNTVTSQRGGLEKFSTVTFSFRSIGLIAAVCMQTASLLSLVNTYDRCKNYREEPRCPKTPKFPSFLVSRIVCRGYSTLHVLDWPRTERNPLRNLFDQRTVLLWTTRPSANKGPGLLCCARRGLGRGHKKTRSLTDGIFPSFLILMKLMFYGISFSKKVFHIRKQLR